MCLQNSPETVQQNNTRESHLLKPSNQQEEEQAPSKSLFFPHFFSVYFNNTYSLRYS